MLYMTTFQPSARQSAVSCVAVASLWLAALVGVEPHHATLLGECFGHILLRVLLPVSLATCTLLTGYLIEYALRMRFLAHRTGGCGSTAKRGRIAEDRRLMNFARMDHAGGQ